MNLSSIVSRVYIGFFILICIMLSSAWFAINATKQMSSRIEAIVVDSTPLMTRSSELTIAFLNINRSLTPYLSAMYADQLAPFQAIIDTNISHYETHLEWLAVKAKHNAQLSDVLARIQSVSETVLAEITTVTDLQVTFLNANDSSSFHQSKFQPLTNQLNSNLVAGLSGAITEQQQGAIENLLSQLTVLSSDASRIFSLQDMSELRSVTRNFSNRKPRFEEAVEQLKLHSPELFSSSEMTIQLLSKHLFASDGAIAKHLQTYTIYESLKNHQQILATLIDEELGNIKQLSEYANVLADKMYKSSSESAQQTIVTISTISVFSMLVALIIGISIVSIIKRPNQQVQCALEKLADKDLRSKVEYRANNEFGYVAQKVNLVLDHLSKVILKMRLSANELNQASIENQQTSESLKASISEQTAQTVQVSAAMQQIECAVNEIAQGSNQTLSIVTEAVDISNNGQIMMKDNVSLLDTLSQRLSVSTQTIQTLEEEAISIESILEVISSISGQTNLLSLNAAIEAARAGEHGRGFSVVADEVRVLAEKTTQLTLQIQTKIEQLQSRSSFAVSQISQCATDMGQCVTQADSVNNNLQEMHQLLNDIEDRTTQIASATTEHQTVASTVTKHVSHIHALAESTDSRFDKLILQGKELELMAEQQLALTANFKLSADV